jgi:hypothetical protein
MALSKPPKINGEMTLTDTQIKDITDKLVVIRSAFEETDEQPVCDTFYLTATYNKENTFKINGDTCEALLEVHDAPVIEETPSEVE